MKTFLVAVCVFLVSIPLSAQDRMHYREFHLGADVAAIAALVASGLPTREFTFVGFVEKKSGPRRRLLEHLLAEGRTVVLYESPYRVADLLADLASIAPAAPVVIARELTKLHEEVVRGMAGELAERFAAKAPKGEVTIVFGPPTAEPPSQAQA